MRNFDEFFKSPFTVDIAIFGFDAAGLKILLIKRGEEPFKNEWALPGYFVHEQEDLDTAAGRVLKELTGLENVYLEQVNAFGKVDRHPAGRIITIAYYSLIKISDYKVKPASIAQKAEWHSIKEVKDLAFDHNLILNACFSRLKKIVRDQPIGFELLPPKFTLSELQYLYESILNTELDKRNFRKKILSMEILVDLNELQAGVAHRPAKLYKFEKEKYKKFIEEGFSFDI